ncbi:MAG: ABC transporter ATP-binding protein [Acidimicrobiales bacterium]
MREVVFFHDGRSAPADTDPVPLREAAAATARAVRLAWSAKPASLAAAAVLHVATASADPAQALWSGTALEALEGGERARSQTPRLVALGAMKLLVVAGKNASNGLRNSVSRAVTHQAEGRILDVVAALELADVEDPAFQDRLQQALSASGRIGYLVGSALDLSGFAAGTIAAAAAIGGGDRALIPLAVAGVVPQWLLTRSMQDPMRAMRRRGREGREGGMLRHYLTTPGAAHELRAFDSTAYMRRRHDEISERNEAEFLKIEQANRRRLLTTNLAATAGVVPAAGRLVLRLAGKQTTLGGSVAGGLAARQLTQGIGRLVNVAGGLRRTAAVTSAFHDFVASQPPPMPGGLQPSRDFRRITVRDVSFTYRGGTRPVLQGVDLDIGRGEVVALVGENGSGKTTLAKLLCALYRPTSGTIHWDDVDTADCDPAAVRAGIAVVFQDFVHYPSLTAGQNIGIGMPSRIHDRAAIEEAAHRAGAHDVIEALPDGYDTLLSRNFGGTDLSTGQWQRVALARAFLRDAPLVVLDEPTAALDPRAERDLFQTVASLYRSRSALLISHRLSSVRFADRICVLAGGRIIESGPHDELLALGGTYAELFELQAHAYR